MRAAHKAKWMNEMEVNIYDLWWQTLMKNDQTRKRLQTWRTSANNTIKIAKKEIEVLPKLLKQDRIDDDLNPNKLLSNVESKKMIRVYDFMVFLQSLMVYYRKMHK
ncbi:hypothetical protein M8C21_011740, partial [Ambrosia artemisiifolia]